MTKISLTEYFLRIAVKIGKYALCKLLGFQYEPLPKLSLDQHIELEISPAEAAAGCEKGITHKRGKQARKLMVKIPPGVKAGTKIRLNGMGIIEDKKPATSIYISRLRASSD